MPWSHPARPAVYRGPDLVAMKLIGHRTRSVFDRYDITSPGDLREAARKLDTSAMRISEQAGEPHG